MRLMRMADLCRQLGIPRRTFQGWVSADPELAVWRKGGAGGGSYWIKLEKLAEKQGITLIEAYMLPGTRWVRASHLAKVAGFSRWTLQKWCRDRPGFGKRIGRSYWIDINQLGSTEEEICRLLGELEKVKRGSQRGVS